MTLFCLFCSSEFTFGIKPPYCSAGDSWKKVRHQPGVNVSHLSEKKESYSHADTSHLAKNAYKHGFYFLFAMHVGYMLHSPNGRYLNSFPLLLRE